MNETVQNPEGTLPQFALVIQDSPIVGGDLDISGGFHPDKLLDDSPAHIVGTFIRDNFTSIIDAAMEERARAKRLASTAAPAEKKLIVPGGLR